ncbi:four helix bundle protein [Candidatus Margulisiibacteriota bacterium]
MVFDLRERTEMFSINIINLIGKFPKNVTGIVIAKQILRSGTSVGANLEEADAASSRKDFFHKISICTREAKETNYWFRIIIKSKLLHKNSDQNEAKYLLKESEELSRIFSAIIKRKDEKETKSS